MPSAAKLVSDHLAIDAVTREALARGIVSFRALARWLRRTQGWDASEEALVSALRREARKRLRVPDHRGGAKVTEGRGEL